MLEWGEMPVHQVMADLKNMPEGEIYELTVPLLTVPLIEKAASWALVTGLIRRRKSCL